MSTYDVTVVGCGLMGSAIARAFAAKGLEVAAWNRTHEKAGALDGDGVTPVESIDEAVQNASLVVTCTSTYETSRAALDLVTDWTGTTLAVVGTGTPTEAQELQAWATERGAAYLDGAILCYPQDIGGGEGCILYSGSPEAWAQNEQTLMVLGPYSSLVAEDVRGASVVETSMTGAFFVSSLNAYIEAVTYALSQGVGPEVLQAITDVSLQALQSQTAEALRAIAADEHATDQATLAVYAEGSRMGLGVMRAAGFRSRLLGAAVENLDQAEEAGLGDLGFYALTKVAGE